MFNIGDVIIYSEHGLCVIDDICEKKFADESKQCYVLHPIDETSLTIITPVDNDKVMMLKLIEREEAEEIMQLFHGPGVRWIEDAKKRQQYFQDVVKSGNRQKIAKVANTLMKKSHELSMNKKKFYEQDRRILQMIQKILFKEMAIAMDTTYEEVSDRIDRMTQHHYTHA